MIPQSFLDELMARSDIADVVGSYVSLSPKGSNLWACCPFHNEKTPSFSVSTDKQIYYCFGCHKGGGAVNFIMEMENLSYVDAVRFLAKRAGMTVPETGDQGQEKLRARLLALNRDAARWYYDKLQSPDGAAVQAYLDKRQIRKKIAVSFGMGASTPNWSDLIDAMTARGYTKAELISAGLAVQNKNGRLYDKFRNRLILPVIDQRGDVVGFGSRVIDNSEPKYMNTTETPVYSKRRVLYGLNIAKKTKRPNIILCEGNLDVVTLHQAGFDNAVASMGTALTEEQIRLLSKYTHELVLCYDNDGAGQKATERALDMLKNTDFTVRVLKLPNRMVDGVPKKQDADDYIKAFGAPAFERLLSGSAGGIDFRIAQVAGKYDLSDDDQRIAYAAEISGILCTLQNAVEREVYTVKAAQPAGLPPEALKLEVERAFKSRRYKARQQQERRELNPAANLQPQSRSIRYTDLRSAMAEEGVIRLLQRDPSLFGDAPPIRGSDFSSPLLGKAFDAMWPGGSLAALAPILSGDEMSHITGILHKPESTANADKALQDYIRIILEQKAKRESDSVSLSGDEFKDKKGYGGKRK